MTHHTLCFSVHVRHLDFSCGCLLFGPFMYIYIYRTLFVHIYLTAVSPALSLRWVGHNRPTRPAVMIAIGNEELE